MKRGEGHGEPGFPGSEERARTRDGHRPARRPTGNGAAADGRSGELPHRFDRVGPQDRAVERHRPRTSRQGRIGAEDPCHRPILTAFPLGRNATVSCIAAAALSGSGPPWKPGEESSDTLAKHRCRRGAPRSPIFPHVRSQPAVEVSAARGEERVRRGPHGVASGAATVSGLDRSAGGTVACLPGAPRRTGWPCRRPNGSASDFAAGPAAPTRSSPPAAAMATRGAVPVAGAGRRASASRSDRWGTQPPTAQPSGLGGSARRLGRDVSTGRPSDTGPECRRVDRTRWYREKAEWMFTKMPVSRPVPGPSWCAGRSRRPCAPRSSSNHMCPSRHRSRVAASLPRSRRGRSARPQLPPVALSPRSRPPQSANRPSSCGAVTGPAECSPICRIPGTAGRRDLRLCPRPFPCHSALCRPGARA